MKISTFFLSVCGLSVFYLCYADWIDRLLEEIAEDYLGFDYEEVPPFIPSVASGTEEFDSIVEEMSRTPENKSVPYFVAVVIVSLTVLLVLIRPVLFGKCLELLRQGQVTLKSEWDLRRRKSRTDKNEPVDLISGIFGKYPNRRLRWGLVGEDVPVQVIWKGNGLMESSVHCNLKDKVHKETKVGLRPADFGAGDITGSPSNESTVQRLAEMRKLLESEPEMTHKLVDKAAGTEEFTESAISELRQRLESDMSLENCQSHPAEALGKTITKTAEENESGTCVSAGFSVDSLPSASEDGGKEQGKDSAPDPKLMNRIRLLESRLRLEELKNRNWISRMSRAEGILQQLNKQVERIERSGPVETTLLETLKITSTVTNWMPVTQPRKNIEFTLVKRYPQQYHQSVRPQCESLSEYIKREISLPCPTLDPKRFMSLPKCPSVKALPSAALTSKPSILSKFLSK